MLKVKVIYENSSMKPEIKPGWGFSALLEYYGKKILFDTGGNAEKFEYNLKKLNVEPEDIGVIVVSHKHWDHVAGLPEILHPDQTVYLLKSFPKYLKKQVIKARAKLVEVERFRKIMSGVYTSGALKGKVAEESLIIDSPKGLIIVTGCSHPGIVKIVRFAKQKLQKNICFLIGGFHLKALRAEQVRNIVKELKGLGVEKIAPCHCTGKRAVSIFRKELQKDFIKVGAGSIIDASEI